MLDLLLQHRGHHVGAWPTCPCRSAHGRQAAFQPDIDVLVLVGRDPGLPLDEILAGNRAGLHRGVDLVAGAVEEAGVDEGHPVLRRADAFLEVDRGAALLVHDAELHGVALQAQHLLDRREVSSAKATSSGPCIFGFTT
jgi:hypothetical protein